MNNTLKVMKAKIGQMNWKKENTLKDIKQLETKHPGI